MAVPPLREWTPADHARATPLGADLRTVVRQESGTGTLPDAVRLLAITTFAGKLLGFCGAQRTATPAELASMVEAIFHHMTHIAMDAYASGPPQPGHPPPLGPESGRSGPTTGPRCLPRFVGHRAALAAKIEMYQP